MKRFFYLVTLLMVLATAGYAQSGCVDVEEIDGSPRAPCIRVLKVTNGTLSCPTTNNCVLTISGGGGGSPGGANGNVQWNNSGSFDGVAGFNFNGTSAITLGVAGTSVGSIGFRNATSGTITVQPVTGALGTVTLSLPATTGTLALTSQLTAGTVTSVSFTGGLISVATATTTPAFTVAGTSGGVPYFSSGSTWATSAALAANAIVLGGGAGAAPATTTTGTGVVTALGVNVGSAGAFVTFNGALGTPSSGTLTNATGLPPTTGIVGWPANASGVLTNNGSGTLSWGAGGSGLTVGTTTVTSGTGGRLFYETAGNVLGEVSGATSNGTAVTFTSGNLIATSPQITTGINDSGGNELFLFTATGSAVNEITVGNASTGNSPTITATGGDTNIGFLFTSKGSGAAIFRAGAVGANPSFSVQNSAGTSLLLANTNLARIEVTALNSSGNIQLTGAGANIRNVSGGLFCFSNSTSDPSTCDTILMREAAANFRLGAAPAASPVAQTLSVQNVVTGTSNTAGATWTHQASLGTSQGAPGRYHITGGAMIAASGTTVQTAVDRAIFNATKVLTNNSATTIVNVTNASNTSTGGVLDYCVEVFDATDTQYECGMATYGISNKAGAFSGNTVTKFGNHQNMTAGTLTVTIAISAANPGVLSVNANSSLTPSTGYPRIVYSLRNLGNQAVAVQ